MQFFFFHLMPYADLDLAAAAEYRSAWTVLPNTLYDPVKGADLYNRYLDELEYADTLGFDGICVNEHHQTAYGLMPAPNVLAGALSRRTSKAKIAVLGRALPLLNNPITVAEEYAILDNITRGRLIAGFVRGIGAEYHASSIDPTESRDRFNEAHDMIVRAWTEPGPFAFAGKYYKLPYVNPWPRPYQKPHPPIWIPTQGSPETMVWASASERRYPIAITFSPGAVVKQNLGIYREYAEKAGYTATPGQLGWAMPIYVAETDEIARREAKPHLEVLFNNLLRMPPEMLLPPGHTTAAGFKKFIEQRKGVTHGVTGGLTLEMLLDRDIAIVGSPATVRDKLAAYEKETTFGNCLALMQFGTLPADQTKASMELFAAKVMPSFRGAAAG
jgi:alkanesulfonate monooxygenase SsuD/methylene tetrahydromethanopterin reductase-like flavin-dependent oxidoreductase (luciferase family)